MVRRPRHDAVVRRPVAEGGLRQLHGGQGGRGDRAGVQRLERVPPAQGGGLPHRRDAGHDADLAARCANLSAAKSAYGSIVYSKAPAVLRQAEFYLGARRLPPRGAGVRAVARVRRRRLERPRPRARGRIRPQAGRVGGRVGEAPRHAGRPYRVACGRRRAHCAPHARAGRPRSAATASGRCAPSCWSPATAPPRTLAGRARGAQPRSCASSRARPRRATSSRTTATTPTAASCSTMRAARR